ncbi:MAG TPA: AMP-binding protein [Acidimicrobiia bacterium]|nr:AMP-binding protein [Acidimicrobiia bacterium]
MPGVRPQPTFAPTETLPWAIERWAHVDPDRPFLRDVSGSSRTYAEFHDATLRWADAFRRVGVTAGDNVPAMVRTSVSAEEHWLGLGWLRAVHTGVNTDFRGSSLAYVLTNCAARRMICAREFLDRVVEIAPQLDRLELVIVTDADPDDLAEDLPAQALPAGSPLRVVSASTIWDAAEPATDLGVPERHEIACISYTSGTTGPSKGVLVPWGRLWPNHAWIDVTGDDVFYCAFPVFHLSGMLPLAWLGFPGGQVVLRDSFKTRRFWADVRQFGCTTTALIPAMMNWLIDEPARADDVDNPLRFVNGAPVVPRVDDFKQRFGVEMRTLFGNTEIGTPLFAGPDVSADWESTALSVTPGYEVRVADENDDELPAGQVGELLVRTTEPWRMTPGYFGMAEQSAAAWRNGWFHTGDGFVQDERGRYHFVDRIKDSIRRRGENISSMEVEAVVNEHAAVAETVAIAVPSEHGEDEVKICVVLHGGAELPHAELHEFLAARMPPFMVPRYIEYLDDPERTAAMQRIVKSKLREHALNERTWDAQAPG